MSIPLLLPDGEKEKNRELLYCILFIFDKWSDKTMYCILFLGVTADLYLSSITTLGSELVDLRFSDVGTLLSLLQLMLDLPELGHVGVGLFLLG